MRLGDREQVIGDSAGRKSQFHTQWRVWDFLKCPYPLSPVSYRLINRCLDNCSLNFRPMWKSSKRARPLNRVIMWRFMAVGAWCANVFWAMDEFN